MPFHNKTIWEFSGQMDYRIWEDRHDSMASSIKRFTVGCKHSRADTEKKIKVEHVRDDKKKEDFRKKYSDALLIE